MSLKKIMHRNIRKTDPDTTIGDVARLMKHHKIGSIFIEEEGRCIGIVTESALVRRVLTAGTSYRKMVRKIMDSPVISVDIEQSPIEANHKMHFNGIRHLGVSSDGEIVGMLSVRDLVRHFSSETTGPFATLHEITKPLTILVHREIWAIAGSASALDAAKTMAEKKVGALLITEPYTGGENYVGIVTEADLVRMVIGRGLSAADLQVGEMMTHPIIDIDISRSIEDANNLMASSGVRHLAVTEGGKIIGILSIRDLIGMISIRDLPRFFKQKSPDAA
jgi:signal-transduction protein with cAMP-binding, CBS, and nucleotidyltransferase domain